MYMIKKYYVCMNPYVLLLIIMIPPYKNKTD